MCGDWWRYLFCTTKFEWGKEYHTKSWRYNYHHTTEVRQDTQLKALIDNTESINTETYTDESVNELKAAVEKGNTLLRGVPGQDAIEETYMEIVNAIQGLTKKDTQ